MGHGSYKASDWKKLKESRGVAASSTASQLFSNRTMLDKYNPRFINMRESCDSKDSPESTPIIIGFDVTGSMGYLAEEIAKNALNKTISNIYDKNPVTNPHIMCAAIGDVCDRAPLQVTQFEADIRIVEQLLELWLEGSGGDAPESFNLLWYFADRHTKIDSYTKRNKKGFLFTIGDAATHPKLSAKDILDVFGDQSADLNNQQLLADVSEKYEVFHIIVARETSVASWENCLPGRIAYISGRNIQYLSEVITTIMQITTGMTKEDAIAQWPEAARTVVASAVATIHLKPNRIPAAKVEPKAKKSSFFSSFFNR